MQRKASLLDVSHFQSHEKDYNPFEIQRLQLYNPIYTELFGAAATDETALDHQYEVVDVNLVRDLSTNVQEICPIHFKFSPLLDPFLYMTGKYNAVSADSVLPTAATTITSSPNVLPKIANYCNAAYVDGFFNHLSNMLLEKHGFLHGIKYYGSYLGIQKRFKVNVTDDMDLLRSSRFFNHHHGKLFTVPGMTNFLNEIGGSRRNKRKINVIEDETLLDSEVETLEQDNHSALVDAAAVADDARVMETVYEKEEDSTPSQMDESSDSELNYSSEDEDEDEDEQSVSSRKDDEDDSEEEEEEEEESSDGEDEPETFGFIHDFPCQMICMEKCDGTLDELFVDGYMDTDQATSAMLQVIFTLIAYQKAFGFSHNDLHTNNIMYVFTDHEFLHYRHDGVTYRVPTYGRIYKIIDFGRSIYTYQKHVFCSDSFFANGDAATQYNFGPCMDPHKPLLEPNPSFDLCRLGVSIFDFVMDVDTDVDTLDAFQRTIRRWCQDDRRHNVLYKRSGEDRYPEFKLYKMIARTVHRHTPQAQLAYCIFRKFVICEDGGEDAATLMDLDALPSFQT